MTTPNLLCTHCCPGSVLGTLYSRGSQSYFLASYDWPKQFKDVCHEPNTELDNLLGTSRRSNSSQISCIGQKYMKHRFLTNYHGEPSRVSSKKMSKDPTLCVSVYFKVDKGLTWSANHIQPMGCLLRTPEIQLFDDGSVKYGAGKTSELLCNDL